jgi:phosphate transport system substrate-binding protein
MAAWAKRPEVREFVEFFNGNADKLVREVKYVPLPAAAYNHNVDALAKMRVGTKFGGENLVGVTIEQLMKLEAK